MKKIFFILVLLNLSACSPDFNIDEFKRTLPGSWESSEVIDLGDSLFIKYTDKVEVRPDDSYIVDTEQYYYSTRNDQFNMHIKASESGMVKAKSNRIFFTPSAIKMTYFRSNVEAITEESILSDFNEAIGSPQEYIIKEYDSDRIYLIDIEYDELRVLKRD